MRGVGSVRSAGSRRVSIIRVQLMVMCGVIIYLQSVLRAVSYYAINKQLILSNYRFNLFFHFW
jgi:hypothetical protein